MLPKASSTWLIIGVTALAMAAQVFGVRGLNTMTGDACGMPAVAAEHTSCCGSDEPGNTGSDEGPLALDQGPCEPEPMPCCPCDGPCDCQTCLRILLPSPVMACLNSLLDLPMASSPSAFSHESMPQWLALSVPVQPPIV